MKRMNQMGHNQIKTAGRKLAAFLCSLMLLISSSGVTAFADDGIYSVPVTAPGNQTTATPAPEVPEETAAPEEAGPEEEPETTEAPAEQPGGEVVPEDDGIEYQAGSLAAETDGCSALIEYTADARIPEGAVLTLRKAEGMEVYACMKSASKLLKNQEADETWENVLAEQGNQFYVITLMNAEGEEIKPASGVILTFQQPEVPEGVTYVMTGNEAAFLENNSGIIRVVGYAMDPLGYVVIQKNQIANVTLTYKGKDFTVTATYGPDAGFPAGTEMKVREIKPGTAEYARYSGMTEEALNEEWSEITLERYFDITFLSGGNEIEPQADIDVQIVFHEAIELTEEHDVQAVHIENNEATVIESETESNDAAIFENDAIDTVSFSSDSFSVYGVVQRKKITKKVLAADGNTYEINMTYGPEAEIPEGAELKVVEIPEGSDLWEAYRQQTAAALGADDVRLPGLYDITIIYEGQEIEPKAPVSVAITLANAEAGNEDLHVVHFTEDIPQELVEAAAEQTEVQPLTEENQINSETINADVDGQTVTFETESFSIYAFAYTVDFHYTDADGNLLEWSYPGRGTYPVSNILEAIGGEGEISSVSLELVEGELIEGALYLTQDRENVWFLNSDVAFTDIYQLSIYTNKAIYKLKVTDASDEYIHIRSNDRTKGYFDSFQVFDRAKNVEYENGRVAQFDFWTGRQGICNFAIMPTDGNRYVTAINSSGEPVPTKGRSGIQNWEQGGTYTGGDTFIFFFVPEGQYLIRYQAGEHGRIETADRYVKDYNNNNYYYSYSGDDLFAHAVATDWWCVFDGWYQGDTFLSADEWLNLSDVTEDMVVTARFRERQLITINYHSTWYYTNLRLGTDGQIIYAEGNDGANANETIYEGYQTVKGATASSHGTGNDYSYFIAWIDADGKRVCNNATFEPTGDQIRNTTYTAVFTKDPNYVVIDSDYYCGTVGGDGNLFEGLDLSNANRPDSIVLAKYNNNSLLGNLWPIPKEGYEFDHWEFNGQPIEDSGTQNVTVNGQTASRDHVIRASNPGFSGQGTLKAVYKPKITYDIGQINRVGINASDYQYWYTDSVYPAVTVSGLTAVENSDGNIFSELVNSGSDYTIRTTSRQTRVTQTNNRYNLLTHYFTGWKADRDIYVNNQEYKAGTLIPADVINADGGAKVTGVTDAITFTAVWSSTFPGKTVYNGGSSTGPRYNTNTVGFFVRLFDSTFDKGDTRTYTDCLYTARLLLSGSGGFATNDSVTGARADFFGNSDEKNQNNINAIDAELRTMGTDWLASSTQYTANTYASFSGAEMKLDGAFPSDSLIFRRIRAWNASAPADRKIEVNGVKIPQYMLTSDYFDIKWYVLKDQENSWHIDGMLIPKYAELVVKKTFIGPDDALTLAENNYQIVVEEQGALNPDTKTLTLTQESSADVTVAFDAAKHEYTWVLHKLIPLTQYKVTESNYRPGTGYTTTVSYQITNIPTIHNAQQTSPTSGSTDYAVVDHVASYAPGTDDNSKQTVAFTNLYTKPYVMTILKRDGTTLHGLENVTFDYVVMQGSNTILSGERQSDSKGQITIDFPHNEGVYTFTLTEHEVEGYDAISIITGTATVASNGAVTLDPVTATVDGDNALVDVDGIDHSIVYITNTPERKNVIVEKKWTKDENKPVTIQLLRDGVPVSGMSIVLFSAEASTTDQPRTSGNTWQWENLPAYVDGHEVIYTVREEWIGEPGGNTSIHYNTANNNADGYEDYIVSQTVTQTVIGNTTVATVYIENTTDKGQVIFSKTNSRLEAVSGARFAVYNDQGYGSGAPAVTDPYAKKLNSNNEWVDAVYESDENGIVTVDGLETGKYYWIREIQAPEGYEPVDPANPDWHLLRIEKTNSKIYPYDESHPGYAGVDLSQQVLNVINEPAKGSIEVQKNWSDGNKDHSGESVTLKLIRYRKSTSQQTETNGTLNISHVASGLNNTALPAGFEVTYSYTGPISASGQTGTSFSVPAGEYTVTASVSNDAAPEGYSYHSTTSQVIVNVPAGGSATASFTSTYSTATPTTGTLIISHTSAGLSSNTLPNGFSATYSYSGAGSAEGINAGSYTVPAGDYTVTVNVSNYAAPEGYEHSNTTESVTAHVPAGGSATAAFTSTYAANQNPTEEKITIKLYRYNTGNNPPSTPTLTTEIRAGYKYVKVNLQAKPNANPQYGTSPNNLSYISFDSGLTGYDLHDNSITIPIQSGITEMKIYFCDSWGGSDQTLVFKEVIGLDSSSGIEKYSEFTIRYRAFDGAVSGGSGSQAPAGYEPDTTFNETAPTVTLNTGNSWKDTFSDLLIYDEEGNLYYYAVAEQNVPTNYIDSYSPAYIAANTDTTVALNVTNALKKGSLKIQKRVLLNDSENAVNGTFRFGIYSNSEGSGEPVATGEIVLNNESTDSVTVTNLYYGTYYVFELNDENQPITTGSATIGGTEYSVSITGSPVTVSATSGGSTADVTAVNNEHREMKGSLALKKIVAVHSQAAEGDLEKTNGQYNYTVIGPEGTKYMAIRAHTADGVTTYTYKVDDTAIQTTDTTGFTAVPNAGVIISDLTPGQYTVTETGWTLEAALPAGTDLYLADLHVDNDSDANIIPADRSATVTVTAGNTTSIPTAVFTNALPVEIHAKKAWKQGETNLTIWPEGREVTFQLQHRNSPSEANENSEWENCEQDAFGESIEAVTVSSYDTVSFTNLPAEGEYRIAETKVDGDDLDEYVIADGTGYGTAENPLIIANPVSASVTVDKTWLIGEKNVNESLQNAAIKVQLMKDNTVVEADLDGTSFGEAGVVTIDGSNDWTYTWENLPKYDSNEEEITYTVVETEATVNSGDVVFDGSEEPMEAEQDTDGAFHLTNPLPETEILVSKAWENGEDTDWPDGIKEITVGLYKGANTEPESTITFNKDTVEAERTFDHLPVYDEDGSKITYSVKEQSITLTDNTVVPVEGNLITYSEGEETQSWIVINGAVALNDAESNDEETEIPEHTALITNSQNADKVFVVKRWHNAYGKFESEVNIPVTVSLYEAGTNVLVEQKETPAVFTVDPEKQYYAVETTTDGYLVWYDTVPLENTPHAGNIMTNEGSSVTVTAGGTIYIHNTATQVGAQVISHKKWIEFRDTGGQFYLGQMDGDNTALERYKMQLDVNLYYDIYDLDGNKLTAESLEATDTFRVWHSNSGHTFNKLSLHNKIVEGGDDFNLIEIGDWSWGFKEGEQNGNQGDLHGKLPLYGYYKVDDEYQLVKYAYHFDELKVYDGSEDWDNPTDVTNDWWKYWENKKLENDTAYTRTNIENRPKKLPIEKEWKDSNGSTMDTEEDLARVQSITVNLLASVDATSENNGHWWVYKTIVLNRENNWQSMFVDLNYRVKDLDVTYTDGTPGKVTGELIFKVEEVWQETFKRESLTIVKNNGTITNKLMPLGSIVINKQWENGIDMNAQAVLLKLRRITDHTVEADAMEDVYNNPATYGLTANDIYQDAGGEKYIKITKGSDGWPSLTIQNLLIRRMVQGAPGQQDAEKDVFYYIEEMGYLDADGAMQTFTSDWTVTYAQTGGEDNREGHKVVQAKESNYGTLTVRNKVPEGKVQVTKVFVNLPESATMENFRITASWTIAGTNHSVELAKDGTQPDHVTLEGNGSEQTPYVWTIDGLPVGTEVTFTESGYDGVAGYIWSGTVNGEAPGVNGMTGNAVASVSEPLSDDATVAFVNSYTAGVALPGTGGSGTLPYTVAGLALILIAGVFLAARRRRKV